MHGLKEKDIVRIEGSYEETKKNIALRNAVKQLTLQRQYISLICPHIFTILYFDAAHYQISTPFIRQNLTTLLQVELD